jgi:hypothetical protein
MRRFLEVQDTGSVTLTTATQNQTEAKAAILGDITSMLLVITNSTTGTLTGAKTLPNAVNLCTISDSNHNVLATFPGSEIPYLSFLTSPRGTFQAGSTVSSTSTTNQWEIALPWKQLISPIYFKLTIEAYSNLATSGATGGSTEVVTNVYYEDDPTITANILSHKLILFDKAVVSGSNDISSQLTQAVSMVQIAERMTSGTDTNFTNTTLREDGATVLESITLAALTERDAIATVSGHQAGFFILPHSPFVPDGATQLLIQASGSDTARIYQLFVVATPSAPQSPNQQPGAA